MSSSKREREYARRRHERWLARQAELRAKRHRRRVLIGSVLGALALLGLIVLAVSLTRGSDEAEPVAQVSDPTAEPTTPAPDPGPVDDGVADRPVPDAALAEARTWTTTLSTSVGEMTLELDGQAAPQAVASFITLAQEGFFDATSCHRLSDVFKVLQCGDPTGLGTGGPGYRFGPIENAPADDLYPAGTVAMARVADQGASMGSQFFLVYEDTIIPADTAGGYTVLGTITSGQDVLRAVAEAGTAEGAGETPATEVIIEGVETQ